MVTPSHNGPAEDVHDSVGRCATLGTGGETQHPGDNFSRADSADVRYLVAGGVALNAYGHQRLTQDLDLVIDLRRENVLRALEVLSSLGYDR